MKTLHDLKTKTKMFGGFAIVLMLLIITGYVGYNSTKHVYACLKNIFHVNLPAIDYLAEADRDLQQLLVAERSMIFADVKSEIFATLVKDYEENLHQAWERLDKFAALPIGEESKKEIAQLNSAWQQWLPLSRQIVDGRKADTREGRRLALDLSLGKARERFESMRAHINTLTELVLRQADSSQASATNIFRSAAIAILLTVGLAVVTGLTIAWLTAGSIVKPLNLTVAMIREIGQGNLDQRLHLEQRDEIGQLAEALDGFADNMKHEVLTAFERLASGDLTFEAHGVIKRPLAQANAALNEVMSRILRTGDQISAGSSQAAEASKTLSQGATESAASLEQISSSMHQMAEQTRRNAENAVQTESLANHAKAAAEKGNLHMQSMSGAMDEINTAGQDISKIIKTIDEIAFQTNLLALNAAVEAARAGQHGKGFAVVAEEVRNLAARSARAASETAELIESTVEKTARGTQIAGQTAEALQEIVTEIGKVSDLAAEISTASNEQAQGIAQINQGLNQIDTVTQQNTAHAEESAAIAEQLAGEAAELHQMLQQFQLEGAEKVKDLPVGTTTSRAEIGPITWKSLRNTAQGKRAKQQITLDDEEFGRY